MVVVTFILSNILTPLVGVPVGLLGSAYWIQNRKENNQLNQNKKPMYRLFSRNKVYIYSIFDKVVVFIINNVYTTIVLEIILFKVICVNIFIF